ncbi:sulfotransferase 1C4-like isoform X2 [Hydractinia symbiolongicarpus]|uniref:sulfotransferase 1C4-like isoform X2 n=1 Tax=Hydractinia symbiolongicarpus TaxID=13093 RepID=UPI00254C55A8|nr:sulfotransferase 1C4-like isoform X2 [Hydractinia symbiolongicarpus]
MISVQPCTDEFPKVKDQKIVTDGVNSITVGNYFPSTSLELIHNMELKKTDILLATYPRSGTTITRRLLLVMMYGADSVLNINDDKMDEMFPFLELHLGGYVGYDLAMALQDDPLRLLKTHLPIWLAPNLTKAKKIIVARDVKDTLISCYHFYRNDTSNPKEIYNTLEFETFYKMFLSGSTLWGDWYQWYRGWLDASDQNTLLLHYEDLIRNFEETVKKLAEFVDVQMTSELMSTLKKAADFKRMKEESVCSLIENFVRKGVIGDHKNYLDEEKIKFLNDRCQEIVPELSK